jgi:hypothetical protein
MKIYVNVSTNDLPYSTNPGDYVEVNLTLDRFIFSYGSAAVADGQPIPSTQELNSAGVLITTSDVEVPHFFLADASAGVLKEIHNAGNQNKQHVFCVSFDDATNSEPILELWDNNDIDTIANYSLGAGVANNSFFRGIRTTGGLPGGGWTGFRLAGSAVNHFLWLKNGTGAGLDSGGEDLYFNLRITVPANYANAALETPVFAIKYT